MDLWTFAAAAGAGYIAQHLKGFTSGGNNNNLNSSPLNSNKFEPQASPLIEHPQDKKGPLRGLMQRKHLCDNASNERESSHYSSLTEESASTSSTGGHDDFNVFPTSRHTPSFLGNENVDMGSCSCLLLKPTHVQSGSPYSTKNRSNIRSKQMNQRFVKPLNSLESCLMAQLYKENNGEKKKYMLHEDSSLSMPTVRPFLVTDGSRIISRASGDYLGICGQTGENKIKCGSFSEENITECGVPLLPHVESLEIPLKTKVKTRRERSGRTSSAGKMAHRKDFNPQCGSSDGAILFCLGVTVGIISSFWANNQEVDKLNELLKQTENLVQDLQEELEMKDSLTVKELHMENYELHGDPCNNEVPRAVSMEQILNESTKGNSKETHDNVTKNESLSKIEAELEAELERLELSMSSSSFERKLSDFVELDPEFAPDIAPELRANLVGTQIGAQHYADRDGSGSSTTHSAKYAVSPRELSLRLHELLQSRLEERVIELETALENSNKKVEHMKKSDDSKCWRQLLKAGSPSPSIQESWDKEDEKSSDEPVVINLSGEALDAYNEAYDVFANMNEEDLVDSRESLSDHSMSNGDVLRAMVDKKGEGEDEMSGDYENNDEMEKLLIKQILEQKTRGSPAIQRMLSCLTDMDDEEEDC